MSHLTDIRRRVAPYLPNCGIALQNETIRRVAQEFFRETCAWKETIDDVTVADQAEYPIVPADEDNSVIWRILQVSLSGTVLTEGQDWHVLVGSQSTVVLEATPTVADLALEIVVALCPADGWNDLTDVVATDYGQAIADGSKADLMDWEGKPWYSPARAVREHERFIEAEIRAKEMSYSGRGTGDLNISAQGRIFR